MSPALLFAILVVAVCSSGVLLAAGEEQARKALQEEARKEREANEQFDELFRKAATMLQPGPPPPCPFSWYDPRGAEGERGERPFRWVFLESMLEFGVF